MKARPHLPARAHGALSEVFPNLFFVTGTIRFPGPVPICFSRNMTVIREGGRLVLVNAVRLDDAGLGELDRLGRVTDVIRLAGNHGSDDPFYKERYGAKIWAVKGQPYVTGFNMAAEPYFEADVALVAESALPLEAAQLYVLGSKPPEAVIVLPRDGGILISGDALQHWATADPYFSFVGKVMARALGFIKPHNVGPGWLRQCKPSAADLRGLLDLQFDHVLPAHGRPVKGSAKDKFRPAIERAAAFSDRNV